MLHLFLFVPTSPSIMAMSNTDGFTPNHLLQQMYGTNVIDEDVDLEFSDKELELIAGRPEEVDSYDSDLYLHGHLILSYREFEQFVRSHPNEWQQITYVQNKIRNNGVNTTQTVAGVIWNNLRATAPIIIKRAHRGFRVNLSTGELVYNH